MFNFLGDRGTTGEDKRRETLNAYLDNALTPAERDRLEGQLARDATLRAELEQLRVVKLQLRAMPRRRVPRSFALDPALYGRPKAQPMLQLYPVLRGATAMAAFLLIFVFALGAFRGQFGGVGTPVPAAEVSMATNEEEAAAVGGAEESAPFIATAPSAEERAAAEEAAADSSAEIAAPAAITESLPIGGAYPPVEGTVATESVESVPVPEGELQLDSTATAEPTITATIEVMATEVAAVEEPVAEQSADEPPAAENDTAQTAEGTDNDILRIAQIALGVAFLVLLILWLIARRRVRSL